MTDPLLKGAVNALLSPHGGGAGHRADRDRAAAVLLDHGDEGHDAIRHALATASPPTNLLGLISLLPAFERADDVPVLAEILRSASDPTRIVAGQALAAHPHPDALAALLDALDGPPDVAAFAAQALGQRGDRAAIGPLRSLADRPGAEFARQSALESIAQLGPGEA